MFSSSLGRRQNRTISRNTVRVSREKRLPFLASRPEPTSAEDAVPIDLVDRGKEENLGRNLGDGFPEPHDPAQGIHDDQHAESPQMEQLIELAIEGEVEVLLSFLTPDVEMFVPEVNFEKQRFEFLGRLNLGIPVGDEWNSMCDGFPEYNPALEHQAFRQRLIFQFQINGVDHELVLRERIRKEDLVPHPAWTPALDFGRPCTKTREGVESGSAHAVAAEVKTLEESRVG